MASNRIMHRYVGGVISNYERILKKHVWLSNQTYVKFRNIIVAMEDLKSSIQADSDHEKERPINSGALRGWEPKEK